MRVVLGNECRWCFVLGNRVLLFFCVFGFIYILGKVLSDIVEDRKGKEGFIDKEVVWGVGK